jgi:hypothetical protein
MQDVHQAVACALLPTPDELAFVVLETYSADWAYIVNHFDRYQHLARDPAHGGKIGPKSLRESAVGLALEHQSRLAGPISRYPTAAAEFSDANGHAWDVKGWHSGFPSGYNRDRALAEICSEIAKNENVIIDTAKMSEAHIAELRQAVTEAGLDGYVIWYL